MNDRSKQAIYRAAEAMELPSQVMGAPQVEILDGRRILLCGHKGIRCYSPEEIVADLRSYAVRVRGTDLGILSMTKHELLLGGTLESVEIIR